MRQQWRNSGPSNVASQKVFRDHILSQPSVQQALVRYVNSLNLQGQVNKGIIDENQALELFHKAHEDFARNLHTKINNTFTQNQLDLTRLTNPLNMANALNNPDLTALQQAQFAIPGSFATQEMDAYYAAQNAADETAQQINQAADDQAAFNQQAMISEADDAAQQQVAQQQAETADESHAVISDIEKGAIAVGLIKALDDGGDVKKIAGTVDEAFHKITGIKGEGFEKLEHGAKKEIEKIEKDFAPRPKPAAPPPEKEK